MNLPKYAMRARIGQLIRLLVHGTINGERDDWKTELSRVKSYYFDSIENGRRRTTQNFFFLRIRRENRAFELSSLFKGEICGNCRIRLAHNFVIFIHLKVSLMLSAWFLSFIIIFIAISRCLPREKLSLRTTKNGPVVLLLNSGSP